MFINGWIVTIMTRKSIMHLILTAAVMQIIFYACMENDFYECNSIPGISTVEFNPNLEYGSLTDQNGNHYKTIKIGNQTWMAENLRATCYRNGDPIPEVVDAEDWGNLNSGAYCNYNNSRDQDSITTFGSLYNWYAVEDVRKIAPEGWHVPSLSEWEELENFLGNDTVAVVQLKEKGSNHWKFEIPKDTALNSSGFSAVPAGFRPAAFVSMGEFAYWWTSSEGETDDDNAWHRHISLNSDYMGGCHCPKTYGKSIRLVMD